MFAQLHKLYFCRSSSDAPLLRPLGLPTATYVRTLVTHRCTDRTADKSSTTSETEDRAHHPPLAACHGGAHSPDSAQQHSPISHSTIYSRSQQALSNIYEAARHHQLFLHLTISKQPIYNKQFQASWQAGRFHLVHSSAWLHCQHLHPSVNTSLADSRILSSSPCSAQL